MRGVVHAHHAHTIFVGELHAGVHGLVRDRLAELVVSVPDFGSGEARGQLLDLRTGLPAADLAPKDFVEMQRLDGIVRADSVIRRARTKPRTGRGLVGVVTALEVRLRHQRVVLFLRNNVVGFGHKNYCAFLSLTRRSSVKSCWPLLNNDENLSFPLLTELKSASMTRTPSNVTR